MDVCPNCKTTLTSLTNICLNCGYDLEAGETAVTPKRPSKMSPRAEFCRKYTPFAFPVAGTYVHQYKETGDEVRIRNYGSMLLSWPRSPAS